MSQWTAEDFANAVGSFRREIAGVARRMAVSLSNGHAWQVLGHVIFAGKREAPDVEAYQGIGFASRPVAGSSSAEAVVLNVGGANNPAIVATRDEALRSASAGDLEDDEAAIFNTTARVRVKKDGTIEIVSIGGVAGPIATLADLSALKDAFDNWTPVAGDGGAALKTLLTALTATWPVGTTVLIAE